MTSHLNGCVQVESAPNVAPNNYTAAEFNREITKGNINPHQFCTGLPYRMLINNPGPISQQQWQQQCPQNDIVETKIDFNADTIGGLQHIGVGEANDDEHSLFSVGQEDAPNDEDMNLSDHFEDESPLPSMYKDISLMYEKIKHLTAPENRKPTSRKTCKREMSMTGVALSHLVMLVNKHMGSKELYNNLLQFIFEWTKKDMAVEEDTKALHES